MNRLEEFSRNIEEFQAEADDLSASCANFDLREPEFMAVIAGRGLIIDFVLQYNT